MDTLRIVDDQWDYLIVLDACRYDCFEQVYAKHVQGQLMKRRSPGSSTNEWRDKSFPGRYDDIIYITANPQFSQTAEVYGFCAGDHFHRVHEIWKTHWDYDKATVLPDVLTDAAIDIIARTPGKRAIVHYLQPHAPYLALGTQAWGYAKYLTAERVVASDAGGGLAAGETAEGGAGALRKWLFNTLMAIAGPMRLFGNRPEWFVRRLLRMPPEAPMEAALRLCDKHGLRTAYEANLELVLAQVARLLQHLSGKIIITADHGELLGEQNLYSHPTGSANPLLIEVPWLTAEGAGPSSEASVLTDRHAETQQPELADHAESEELARKLRALGYYD